MIAGPDSSGRMMSMATRAQRSELVTAQPAVHRDDRAGDVAGQRRGEEADERRDVLRAAVLADGDVPRRVLGALLGRVVALDLRAPDPAGRGGVDRDAARADLAREALGPRVQRGLGGECAVDALGLGLAGDVHDPAPAALLHAGEGLPGELGVAREVERQRLLPLLLGGVPAERAAAAGVVDQ